ncbi:MAG: DUF72 domain-containing protein [Armatimonadota bacterium]|nr:DUF72 domain-containing protein [Armatimonadota bacterium]
MVRVGLSGFSYKPWQGDGRFYPADLKQKEFLSYYSERYDAVEMDGTWYRMPTEAGVKGWIDSTPGKFAFCCKVHRDISHMRRLKPEAQESLKFMQERLAPMAKVEKLGPFLVQLPPNMKRNDERLADFLAASPKTFRYAVEFRNETWIAPDVEAILREHNAAWVAAETDEGAATKRDTADFAYVRLRKCEYEAGELADWAAYFTSLNKPTYVFLKHEDEGSPWIFADELLANLR